MRRGAFEIYVSDEVGGYYPLSNDCGYGSLQRYSDSASSRSNSAKTRRYQRIIEVDSLGFWVMLTKTVCPRELDEEDKEVWWFSCRMLTRKEF